jgi:ribose-phosphate pyrophosphokinase
MTPLLFCLDDNDAFFHSLTSKLKAEVGEISRRQFPDGETYLNVLSDVKNRLCYIVCNLHQPNPKFLPLIFLADTLRELGAKEVGLVSSYLAYMRQDIRFSPGEALTSKYFAQLISQHFNWLITADPHLHRYHSLSEIYSITTYVVQASTAIASWIQQNIDLPLIVGPDEESEQWVKSVAAAVGCEYIVLSKLRHGDRNVEISVPAVENFRAHTPILVDDIISTGRTMIETAKQLLQAKLASPIAIGVHAVFSESAYEELLGAGIERVVTCNCIRHVSNGVDIAEGFVTGIRQLADL